MGGGMPCSLFVFFQSAAGEDGRIKSAIGIGALLQDGLGDTLRASLTEPPWVEIPVVLAMARMQEAKVRSINLNGPTSEAVTAARQSAVERGVGFSQTSHESGGQVKAEEGTPGASSAQTAEISSHGRSSCDGRRPSEASFTGDAEGMGGGGETGPQSSIGMTQRPPSQEMVRGEEEEGKRKGHEEEEEAEQENSWTVPPFTEETRNFDGIQRRNIRWAGLSRGGGGARLSVSSSTSPQPVKEIVEKHEEKKTPVDPRATFLHKDGTVIVAVHPSWLSGDTVSGVFFCP